MKLKRCLNPLLFASMILTSAMAYSSEPGPIDPGKDYHSYANVDEVVMTHVHLDLNANFKTQRLEGYAELTLKHVKADADTLVLDSKALEIRRVEISDGENLVDVNFDLGEEDGDLGSALTIPIKRDTQKVRIHYNTTEASDGLNWATPEQTHAKKHPFMYSLSQTIYGRTWFPHQDTPKIRVTYSAYITTPRHLRAVMSANNDPEARRNGSYHFDMPQPVVPYLIAIAVGDLAFKPISSRSGIYAESSIIDSAAWEFGDTENMIKAVEAMYGDYAWGRYDLLIMPPSFPFGGMEHARLSFITPTVITGDRGLVQLISHELAHSWSGNFVTNGTWRDLWLNEGFTKYVENRTVEAVYGKSRADMELVVSYNDLQHELEELAPEEQTLAIDLRGQHPDAVFTEIPYAKAQLFLKFLEDRVGRATFDQFVKQYFKDFAWGTVTSDVFEQYLYDTLLADNSGKFTKQEVKQWIYEPGYPEFGPVPTADAYQVVAQAREDFLSGKIKAADIDTSKWMIHQWTYLIDHLPADVSAEKLDELDKALGLSESGNVKLVHQWLLYSIKNGYQPAQDKRLRRLLSEQGRIAYTKRIYRELIRVNLELATEIYADYKDSYHPITTWEVDKVFRTEASAAE